MLHAKDAVPFLDVVLAEDVEQFAFTGAGPLLDLALVIGELATHDRLLSASRSYVLFPISSTSPSDLSDPPVPEGPGVGQAFAIRLTPRMEPLAPHLDPPLLPLLPPLLPLVLAPPSKHEPNPLR